MAKSVRSDVPEEAKAATAKSARSDAPEAVRVRMESFIRRYWKLNRVPVGDETTRFVGETAAEFGAERLSIPSGTECLSWVMPPKWTVHEAYLETLGGERIADFAWNPLYLKSYSAPYSGIVSRETLLNHVNADPHRPDCVIYDYRAQYQFGDRTEWGFSLPHRVVEGLGEPEYRVHIDTEFGTGTLDVLDWSLPGKNTETIFFAAHTCHPAQVNDGIACIAVLIELFRWLASYPSRRYTYRLLLGPEYFAAAAVLAHGKDVDKLKYGFFLDMMGNGKRIGFSRSYRGDSYVDQVIRNVLEHGVDDFFEVEYRSLWGNDELFYDGPDFRIPTIGLGRDRFEHYHTHKDDMDHCDFDQLMESLDLLKTVVDVFERDAVIRRAYKGPLYLSRYGLYIDPKEDRKGYDSLQEIQILTDGARSYLAIANELGISFDFVANFGARLIEAELAAPISNPPTDPAR